MNQYIEKLLRRRFIRLHGEGAEHQADVYRCANCAGLVTWKRIQAGDVCCSGRLTPTNPKFHEKIRLLVAPWSF